MILNQNIFQLQKVDLERLNDLLSEKELSISQCNPIFLYENLTAEEKQREEVNCQSFPLQIRALFKCSIRHLSLYLVIPSKK